MSSRESLELKKPAPPDNGEFDFDVTDTVSDVELLAAKLKSPVKGKDVLVKVLKQLAKALEAAPQDVEALGCAKDNLPLQLLQLSIAENSDKELRMYGALCIMYMMRVYAPDIPYDDEQLKEVFELLIHSWTQLRYTDAAGTFEICRATLQTFTDVKFYIPMLDLEDPDLVMRTFGTLLYAARPESLLVLEAPLLAVITGILEEMDQPPQELCDMVLAALACSVVPAGAGGSCGKGRETTMQHAAPAQRLAAQLLTARDSALRGIVQRQVLSCVRYSLEDAVGNGSGAAAGGGGGRAGKKQAAMAGRVASESVPCDVFALLNGLHAVAPLLLLPVVPELKAQLRDGNDNHRAAAADLVTRLLVASPPLQRLQQQASSMAMGTLGLVTAAPGPGVAAPLATQFPELLQELLSRFADQSAPLRQQMLLRTGELAAVAAVASPDGTLGRQVLDAARHRLHDYDDRVRAAACRGLCSLIATVATGQAQLGSILLHENDMDDVLRDVKARLRDRKVPVRKDAASGLLVAWRAGCTAMQQGALSLVGLVRSMGWIPAQLCTEAQRDLELRPYVMALLAAPPSPQQLLHHTHGNAFGGAGRSGLGMLPTSLGKQLGAAVWAALWASYDEVDRTTVRKLLALKAKAACELQQLVQLRRQLRTVAAAAEVSSHPSPEAAERDQQRVQRRLAVVCRSLARDVGGSVNAATRASEQLLSLVDSAKDNFFWDRLADLAAPGSSPEVLVAARKDALSRLPNGGSKSPVADLVTRISQLAQPALLSLSHVTGLIAMVDAGDAARGGGGGNNRDADGAIAAAANLAVAVSKSAPGLCCAAIPLLVSIVTADPPRTELVCTTAVRVLRRAARHCKQAIATSSPSRVSGSPGVKRGARGGANPLRKGEGSNGPDEEEEGNEEDDQETPPGRAKKRARTAAPAGVTAAKSPAHRTTRGQQRELQQQQQIDTKGKTAKVDDGDGSDDVGDEQRAALIRALATLSQGPYAKAAKASVHALWAVLGPEEGVGMLKQLAAELALQLRPGREMLSATPAVLQAMGSVGEVTPNIFAEHAVAFCKFIVQDYMLASSRRTSAAAAKKAHGRGGDGGGGGVDTGWNQASFGVACKVAALRAMARGCTPGIDILAANAAAVPLATSDAVSSYVTEFLVQLLDIENDMAEYGAVSEADKAHLRIAAARAMLRLASRYDSTFSASSYVALALTMQDPVMEVRQAFGEQVRFFLHSSLQLQRRSHVIAKYAAMLPLAGMDPQPGNHDTAARALREVVILHRMKAQEVALAAVTAARGTAAGGTSAAAAAPRPSLSDLPEFMLIFLVYILAHHPDCPMAPEPTRQGANGSEPQDEEEAPKPEDYRPFQDMLQFALEPLLAAPVQHAAGAAAPAAAPVAGIGEALPAVCKVLRSLKLQMQDADETFEPPATRTMRLLADIGLAVAKAIVERELFVVATLKEGRHRGGGGAKATVRDKQQRQADSPAASAAASVAELTRREHPAHAMVPMRLFKLADTEETRGIRADGSCLPPGYKVVLSPTIAEMGRKGTALQSRPQGNSTGAAHTSLHGHIVGHPAIGGHDDGGGGGSRGATVGSESKEAAERPQESLDDGEEGEDQGNEKAGTQPVPKRWGRGEAAMAGGGDRTRNEPGGSTPPEKGRREGLLPKKSPAHRGRGRGKAAASRKPGAAATKRRRSSGYETLSEGEPSSLSEEEEDDDEEEHEEEDVPSGPKPVANRSTRASPCKGRRVAVAGATLTATDSLPNSVAADLSPKTRMPQVAGRKPRATGPGPADKYEVINDYGEEGDKPQEPQKPERGLPKRGVVANGAGGGGSRGDDDNSPPVQQGKKSRGQGGPAQRNKPQQQQQQQPGGESSGDGDQGDQEQEAMQQVDRDIENDDKENEAFEHPRGRVIKAAGGGVAYSALNHKRGRGTAGG